jgi:Cd(II)/Pb(II)-responsive transcriptional regulator
MMKIGELAANTQTSVETIRFYEQKGLLPEPNRSPSNYREYDGTHEQRLRLIRNCRTLDMSHREIQELLELQDTSSADCSGVNIIIQHHLVHVQTRIDQLKVLEKVLVKLSNQCSGEEGVDSCKILEGLSETLGSADFFEELQAIEGKKSHV